MKKKMLILGMSALFVLSTSVSSSTADAFGTNTSETPPLADNSIHNYCFVGITESFWLNPLTAAMNKLASQTVMTTGIQYSCNEDADVRFFKVNSAYIGNNLGLSYCNEWTNTPGICAGFHVLLNADFLTSTSYRQKTACHEVGHTVGLSHGQAYGGCMITGLSTLNYYSEHHVAHINNYYSNK